MGAGLSFPGGYVSRAQGFSTHHIRADSRAFPPAHFPPARVRFGQPEGPQRQCSPRPAPPSIASSYLPMRTQLAVPEHIGAGPSELSLELTKLSVQLLLLPKLPVRSRCSSRERAAARRAAVGAPVAFTTAGSGPAAGQCAPHAGGGRSAATAEHRESALASSASTRPSPIAKHPQPHSKHTCIGCGGVGGRRGRYSSHAHTASPPARQATVVTYDHFIPSSLFSFLIHDHSRLELATCMGAESEKDELPTGLAVTSGQNAAGERALCT